MNSQSDIQQYGISGQPRIIYKPSVASISKRNINYRFEEIIVSDQVVQRELHRTYISSNGTIEDGIVKTVRYEYPFEFLGDIFILSKDEEGCY